MKRLVDDVDVLLVISAANSSNAKRLVEVARTAGTRAYLINDVGDIRPEWLDGAVRVGITAGASRRNSRVAGGRGARVGVRFARSTWSKRT